MLSTAVTYGVLEDWSVRSWLVETGIDRCEVYVTMLQRVEISIEIEGLKSLKLVLETFLDQSFTKALNSGRKFLSHCTRSSI